MIRVIHISVLHRAADVRIFEKECRTLVEAGYEVHLATHDAPADRVNGVYMHRIKQPSLRLRGIRGVQRLVHAFNVVRSVQPAIFHFHDAELIPVALAVKVLRIAVVYDVHEDKPQEVLTVRGESVGSALAARVRSRTFALLEWLAASVCDGFIVAIPALEARFPPARTILVRNLPLLSEFQQSSQDPPSPRERSVVVYAGGLSRVRGLQEMVEAVGLLHRDLGAQLVLLGSPTNEEARRDLEWIGQVENVVVDGWRPRDELVRVLTSAGIGLLLFHPSRDHLAALPNKLFEYMAAGLPVIASNFPSWRGIVEAEGCGLLVDPLDPNEISGAIRFLLEHPEQADAMGRRGRSAVERRYNWNADSAKLLDLYRSIGGARGEDGN